MPWSRASIRPCEARFSALGHSHPRSSATNRIIQAKDHASVQITIPHVDKEGHLTNETTVIALSGFVRAQGRSDAALNKMMQEGGFVTAFPEYETAN